MERTSRESHAAAKPAKPIPEAAPAHEPGLIQGRWPLLALSALTFVPTLLLFAPLSFWPAGYVAFVPWLVAITLGKRRLWVYLASYLLGVVFFLVHWRWLFSTTPEGYFAGSFFFASYFALAAWPIRHLYRRRGLTLALAFPVVWILVEIIRSRGPLAFPWFLLGHSQIRLLSMVQLADITGVYGISFVLGMVNGWMAELIIRRRVFAPVSGQRSQKRYLVPVLPTALVLLAVVGMLTYGLMRLWTLQISDGPRLAVLQGDYLLQPVDEPGAPTDADKQRGYIELLRESAATQPDMFVLPETPWFMYLNRELREISPSQLTDLPSNELAVLRYYLRDSQNWNQLFSDFAQRENAALVVGGMSMEKQPRSSYPTELRYNSAFVYPAGGGEPNRYDKIHLVLFGEFVPFRYTPYLHWFYVWMNGITPWGADGREYSLTAGSDWRIFSMHSRGRPDQQYRFGVTICYEDVIPQTFRKFAVGTDGGKRIDFMLNISNDGWFGHGAQQGQHLVSCAFRAIENRVGIARSVNTGISGFIAPDGSWYDLVGNGSNGFGASMAAGGTGTRTATIRCCPLSTFYSRHGDVFGLAVALLALAAIADAAIIWRLKQRHP